LTGLVISCGGTAVIEGRIEVREKLGRRSKQIPGELKETRGYWILKKKEAQGRNLWQTRFGRYH